MLNICEKSHIATVINSLDKIYRQSKVSGELNPLDTYYIDIIYKLLYHCNIDITNQERNQLINIYNSISFKSDYVCPNTNIEPFHLNTKVMFTQNSESDCDDNPIDLSKIYYWQEEDPAITYIDVVFAITPEFLEEKDFDNYTNFEVGKTISYSNIGRICFLDNNSSTINYEIKDVLGNDIYSTFTVVNMTDINSVLFVSKNIYSYGDVFIKIKKIT